MNWLLILVLIFTFATGIILGWLLRALLENSEVSIVIDDY